MYKSDLGEVDCGGTRETHGNITKKGESCWREDREWGGRRVQARTGLGKRREKRVTLRPTTYVCITQKNSSSCLSHDKLYKYTLSLR